jgi:hypothetical protein
MYRSPLSSVMQSHIRKSTEVPSYRLPLSGLPHLAQEFLEGCTHFSIAGCDWLNNATDLQVLNLVSSPRLCSAKAMVPRV